MHTIRSHTELGHTRAFLSIYSSLHSSATSSTSRRSLPHPRCTFLSPTLLRSCVKAYRESHSWTASRSFFDAHRLLRYLLGSGGTLMFDVTIVTQARLYKPKGGSRGRRTSRTYNEEEAGLLSAEATGADDSPTTRRRGGSVSREPAL